MFFANQFLISKVASDFHAPPSASKIAQRGFWSPLAFMRNTNVDSGWSISTNVLIGLRSILEKILLEQMYESPSRKDITKIIIDKENVLDDIAPKMVLKESKDDKTA